MAPKAIIETVDQISSNSIDVRGTFTDEKSFKIPFGAIINATSDEEVRARLKSDYDVAIAQVDVKLSLKPGAIIDLTPPIIVVDPPDPPSPPTQEELDLIDYRLSQTKWRIVKKKIDDGIIEVDNPDAMSLLSEVKKKYKVIYLTVD